LRSHHQFAAERLDVAPQGAELWVGAPLELGDGRLPDG
jgi:hypothetical protein